jgi:hypothetical protein
MQAQGAMWVYDRFLEEWRYYLVTSLVDSLGRRRTYKLLLDAFERIGLPKGMNVDDVHLGSPTDAFFRFVTSMVRVSDGGIARFNDVIFGGAPFDGLVYRAVTAPPPSTGEADRIEKRFSKRVKDLVRAA